MAKGTEQLFNDDNEETAWSWKTDAEHRIVNLSRQFMQVLGKRITNIAMQSTLDEFFIAPDRPGAFDTPLRDMLQQHSAFYKFCFTLQQHGAAITVSISGMPIITDGVFAGFEGRGNHNASNVPHTFKIPREWGSVALNQMNQGVAIFNEKNILVQANTCFSTLFTQAGSHIYPGIAYKAICRMLVQYKDLILDVGTDAEQKVRTLLTAMEDDHEFDLLLANGNYLHCTVKTIDENYKIWVLNDITPAMQALEKLRGDNTLLLDKMRRNEDMFRRASFDEKVQHDLSARISSLREDYKRLYTADTTCILRVNPDGSVHSASPALCRLLGFIHDGELRKVLKQVHSHLYIENNVRANLESECREQGYVRDQVVAWRHLASGSRLVVSETMQPVYIDGVLQYFESQIIDMTDTQELAQELEQVRCNAREEQRKKAQFLYHMSHEMRTPLNAVIGFADMMTIEVEKNGHGQYKNYLNDITGAGQSLLNTVDDMLLMLSLSKSDYALNEARFNPAQRLNMTCMQFQLEVARKNIQMVCQIEDHCPELYADDKVFSQCLRRLIENAVKFTPPQGWVRITLRANSNDEIMLRIADNGIGISEERLAYILQPFNVENGDASVTTQGAGAGVGLSIVDAFMRAHDGKLVVKSHEGLGTTVTLSFPSWRTRRTMHDNPEDFFLEDAHERLFA